MKKTFSLAVLATLAAMSLGATAANSASYSYSDNFTDPTGTNRGVETLTLDFISGIGSAAISFELFGARSVDGENGYQDLFTIAVNGTDVFSGSFNMSGGGANIETLNTLGWVWNTTTNPGNLFQGGFTSFNGLVDLIAGTNTFSVTFSNINAGNQGVGDESWALNNLSVAAVPLPAGLPLLLAGLGGLGALRLRKRKASAI